MLVPLEKSNGKIPITSKGSLAQIFEITAMALRLLKRCKSLTATNWKILEKLGKAASTPICTFVAPSKIASATRNVPPVRELIASAVNPSFITRLRPFVICL